MRIRGPRGFLSAKVNDHGKLETVDSEGTVWTEDTAAYANGDFDTFNPRSGIAPLVIKELRKARLALDAGDTSDTPGPPS